MIDTHAGPFLDPGGQPLAPHLSDVLGRLVPRFRRQFPALADDLVTTEVFEEAGRRIAKREDEAGPIAQLPGYAWVTVRSVAVSYTRRGPQRLRSEETGSEAMQHLPLPPTAAPSAESVERRLILRELLTQLTRDERVVVQRKLMGFSSAEIATLAGRSPGAIDTLYCRAKRKLRALVASTHSAPRTSGRVLRERITPVDDGQAPDETHVDRRRQRRRHPAPV